MTRRARLLRPPGIRMQLTLWYATAFAVLIVLSGYLFYVKLQASLASSFDEGLRYHTDAIASGISLDANGSTIIVTDATGELTDLDPTPTPDTSSADQPTPTPDTSSADQPTATPDNSGTDQATPTTTPSATAPARVSYATMVRVLDAHGHVEYVTAGFRRLSVPASAFTRPLGGDPWAGTVTASDGQAVRLYSEALYDNNGAVYGVVQFAESLAPLAATLRRVAGELLLIVPFLLVFESLGSYWLAARALRPINQLAQTARRIEAHTLRRKVTVPGANDEVRRLTLTFNDMMDRLDKAFERQRRFVADASHELRTPVAAIRNMSEVALARDASPEEYAAVLRGINAETERLTQLIGDLLALARADEGQVRIEQEPVRLDLLVADVASTAEALAAERGIAVRVVQREPATVLGDEARLIQALLNLLDNAIAYTDEHGSVELSVVAGETQVWITMRDTGIGIAPEHLPHIFERFYRADPARSRATGGSGLGLAIVDWVVRAHGGSLDVESQVGKGTCVTMRLPLAQLERTTEPSTAPSA